MLSQFLWINGRSGRLQWWMAMIVQIAVLLLTLPFLLPGGLESLGQMSTSTALQDASGTSPLVLPVIPLVAWLGLVANIRRYHDRNKSGWWALFSFVPLIGPLWQFIELGFLRGTEGDNDYGRPGGGRLSEDDGETAPSAKGGLAKVDDAYLADYARRLAETQAAPASAPLAAPAPASAANSFGKRR